jgi:hypothetical protein
MQQRLRLPPPTQRLVERLYGRCPQHPSIETIMGCAACRQVFEDHTARIAKLEPVGR